MVLPALKIGLYSGAMSALRIAQEALQALASKVQVYERNLFIMRVMLFYDAPDFSRILISVQNSADHGNFEKNHYTAYIVLSRGFERMNETYPRKHRLTPC